MLLLSDKYRQRVYMYNPLLLIRIVSSPTENCLNIVFAEAETILPADKMQHLQGYSGDAYLG